MKNHIVFTGGGTGGHVYPALAIIEILRVEGYKISWIGSKKGIEYKIINNLGIDFYSIPSGKLRRYFSFRNFIDIFKISLGFLSSILLLIKLKPDLIFSKGGYVTVPPIVAAKIVKIKSITHESDFDPGLATRINSRFVNKILVPYNETKELISARYRNKVLVTGNPVRKEFFNPNGDKGLEAMGLKNDKPIILVLGGSLGAKQINDLILSDIDYLSSQYYIYHQMGEGNFIESKNKNYISTPFITDNMADIIKAADIVISRSGAGAIWEFVTVGTPSLLIPLSVGSRGDQLRNAEYFRKKGTSLILDGVEVNGNSLRDMLDDYFFNLKNEMEFATKKLGAENCAKKITDVIKELL